MSAVTVDLPNYLRQRLEHIARNEGISLGQLVVEIIEKVSASKTFEEIMREAAERNTRKSFEKFLAAVPDVKPDNLLDKIKN